MRTTNRKASVRKLASNRLAVDLEPLADFANLPDANLEMFRLKHPTFTLPIQQGKPVPLEDFSGKTISTPDADAGTQDFAQRVLTLRNMLRKVWDGNDAGGRTLALLLGIEWMFPYGAESVADGVWLKIGALERARLTPKWGHGRFDYKSESMFQEAVWKLWHESWRAKTCALCSRYFIAGKPPQLYCSTRCAGVARERRNADYWSEHKVRINRKRARKSKREGR